MSRRVAPGKPTKRRPTKPAAAGAAAAAATGTASPAGLAGQYECVALVLQGGGALGAYQCGVYEGMHAAGLRPDWFAGISIGAINAALLAGNPPELRVARLREFWELICAPGGHLAWPAATIRGMLEWLPDSHERSAWAGGLSAMAGLLQGQRGFYDARPVSPFLQQAGSDAATSFYDTAPLLETLQRLVDFDRINDDKSIRLTVGATCVRTGNFVYFDSTRTRICPEHILASGALPPAFAPVEVEGELFWDGGLVSNTPLEHVLDARPRRDTLALQVDLWSARGPLPETMTDVLERIKDIQYSSRTRHGTDTVERLQRLRTSLNLLLAKLPPKAVDAELQAALEPWLSDRVFNVVHLIYQAKPHEEQFKAYAFGQLAMREHWASGQRDMAATLAQPQYFVPPPRETGFASHDLHRLAGHHEHAKA